MKKLIIILLLSVGILVSCDKKEETSDSRMDLGEYGDYIEYIDENHQGDIKNDYNNLNNIISSQNGNFNSNYAKGAMDLFDINNKVEFNISISNEELEELNDDYKTGNQESYRICDLDIFLNEIKYHFVGVGIRQKGNTSRGGIFDNDNKINLRHYKLSFSETFDDDYTKTPLKWDDDKALEFRENRTFFGLEKLNIRWNRNKDKTYLKEHYAFSVYRNNNVLAPHTNPVNFKMNINNQLTNLGVYLLVEDIDKAFINRNLKEELQGGDLYKLGWTYVGARLDSVDEKLFGTEKQVADGSRFKQIVYPYDLKTNKKTSNHEAIKTFINKINSTSKDSFYEFLKDDSIYESVISYLAVSYLLGDPDDLRGNFNNTYLYFTKNSNKAIFIPTDHDRALGSTGYGGNPTGNHGALTKPFDNQTGYSINDTPFFMKTLINGNAQIKADYMSKIKEIIDNKWLDIAQFNTYFNTVKNKYQNDLVLGSIINGHLPQFSLIEENELSSEGNLSIEVYFETKKETFLNIFNNF